MGRVVWVGFLCSIGGATEPHGGSNSEAPKGPQNLWTPEPGFVPPVPPLGPQLTKWPAKKNPDFACHQTGGASTMLDPSGAPQTHGFILPTQLREVTTWILHGPGK